jgi:hypothetical protein
MTNQKPHARRASGSAADLDVLPLDSELERLAYDIFKGVENAGTVTARPGYKIGFTDEYGEIVHVRVDFHVELTNVRRIAVAHA